MSKEQFGAEYLCLPMGTEGLCFPNFSIHTHVINPIKSTPENKKIFVGLDFNVNNMSAILAIRDPENPRGLIVFDEIIQTHRNSNVDSMLREIKTKYGIHNTIICPDSSGRNRDASAYDPTATALRQIQKAGFHMMVDKRNPSIFDTCLELNSKILDAEDNINFRVTANCEHLIESLSMITWDNDKPSKKTGLDHTIDCLRYMINQMFRKSSVSVQTMTGQRR